MTSFLKLTQTKPKIKVNELSVIRKEQANKQLAIIEKEIEINTEVFTGVYLIHNTLHDKKYVGSSSDVNRRIKTHKRELDRGSHNNRLMQKDYDEAGPNQFKYIILERDIPTDLLTAYEKYWMYKHDSIVKYKGYNEMFPSVNHKVFKNIYITKSNNKNGEATAI